MPWPWSTTRRRTRPAMVPASTRTGQSLCAVGEGVVDEVGDDPFEQRRDRPRREGRLGDVDDARRGRGRRGWRARRGRPRRASSVAAAGATAPAWMRDMSRRLSTRLVSRSVSSSTVSRNSAVSSGGPGDVGLAEAVDRRLDPGERGAQVVGDGLEQGAAQLVGLGEGGGFGGLGRGVGVGRGRRRGWRRRR